MSDAIDRPRSNKQAPPTPRAPRTPCTCGCLRKASRRLSQFYDLALAPVGIKTTQFSILSEIERVAAGGPVTMSELATAMVMDRSTLGHNLRPLQRDQLVILRSVGHDGRKRYVELTKEGVRLLRRARVLWRVAEGRFEKAFGKQSAANLRAELLKVANSSGLDSAAPPPARA